MIGWDLDGTLCDIDKVAIALIDAVQDLSLREHLQDVYFWTRAPLSWPSAIQEPRVIITGRPLWAENITNLWVAMHCPNVPVYFADEMLPPLASSLPRKFFSRPRMALAEGKAMQIKRLGVQVYFEDDPEVASALREFVDIPIVLCGGK